MDYRYFYNRIRKYGLVIGVTDILYDKGKSIFPRRIYLNTMKLRDRSIERFIGGNIPLPEFTTKLFSNSQLNTNIISVATRPRIWFMWLQGEDQMPDIVRLCYRSLIKYSGGKEVVLLTQDNFNKYVKLPDFILEKFKSGLISRTHLSDIIRMYLLGHYGGLWMDATILLTKQIPEEIFSFPTWCIHHNRDDQFVFHGRWSVFFWSANRLNIPRYIYNCLLEYYKKQRDIIDYFLTDYMIDMAYNQYIEIKNEIDAIPVNNPNSTKLKVLIDKPFDKDKYNELTSNTWAFKLSYKGFPAELSKTKGTFYEYISNML